MKNHFSVLIATLHSGGTQFCLVIADDSKV